MLPSVGRGPGASNSQWTTTAWIHNPSSSTATVQVMFLERKQTNPAPVTVSVSVPAGDTVRYADVLADLFSFDNKFGALRFFSNQKIVVACRIFNTPQGAADRDTQGQDYAGIPSSFGISKGQSTHLLGVYQTSTDKSVSPFRYSFGLAESAGGNASVRVRAYDTNGTVVAEKDYGPLGAYEVEYYPIEDLSPSIASTNLRLEVAMTDGTGKILAVGSGVANQSNDGTTFEMQFADSLLGGGGTGGLSSVAHDLTLVGDGTLSSPLGIAGGAVVRNLNGLSDAVTLAAGANVTITPSGNTLTIAATGGGGGGSGVPSVNGITSAVTIAGTGGTTVNTAGNTITLDSPSSLPPGGAAGGDLSGTYPNPTLRFPYSKVIDAVGAVLALENTGNGMALYAASNSMSGVRGVSRDPSYSGVIGEGSVGVIGVANTSKGSGVLGQATQGWGVLGTSDSSDGVYGQSTSGYGVHGISQRADGVFGEASMAGTAGVSGLNPSGDGVYGQSTSGKGVWGRSQSVGVVGTNLSSGNYAELGGSGNALHAVAFSGDSGYFQGHVTISGGLDVSGGTKNFRIDHPLDPENRYLVHAAVESNEVLNVYSGNVVTDGQAIAVVPLPDWFEAANTDFRYQLTVIGRFAQAIIEREIERNQFVIRTNLAKVKVSWQVTARRNDAWMRAHPFQPELEKPPAERGTYLTPIEHGQPPEMGVESLHPRELIGGNGAGRDKAPDTK